MFGDLIVIFFGVLFLVIKYVVFFFVVVSVFVGVFVFWVCFFWLLDIGGKWLEGVGECVG